jgi:hypothetical protein
MINNVSPYRKNNSEEDSIDLKELFYRILSSWHWILLCGVLGLVIAYYVTDVMQPTYQITAKLYAPDNNRGMSMENLFEAAALGKGSGINIQNHIGILSSYSITRQTLENLDWRVSWYEANFFGDIDLYKYSPFRVENFNPLLNLPRIEVKITPIDNDYCFLSADDDKTYGKKIEFETKYRYGDSLRNEYFNFVLNKEAGVSIDEDKEYILIFNDLNKLAVEYQNRLDISLT